MSKFHRRKFVKLSAGAGAGLMTTGSWSELIQQALAIWAHNESRSIKDVKHIVILIQENRSFDHYFGAMRGVRGFGDRFPIPLESGQKVFHQSDGKKIIPPYHADGKTSNAILIKGTPHNFADIQAAWNQRKYGYWPLFKTPYSMAYYAREEIRFLYVLAESFTISDAHHCSIYPPVLTLANKKFRKINHTTLMKGRIYISPLLFQFKLNRHNSSGYLFF